MLANNSNVDICVGALTKTDVPIASWNASVVASTEVGDHDLSY